MVVVVDDEDRENEGDLTMAAELVTPQAINFMARHGRGLICAAMTAERLQALRIPLMTQDNTSNFGTAFCESVDARVGVTTGISAADRALTIQALVAAGTGPGDLARPGHVFPLQARAGGVLMRAGQTEAAVDLARLAGLRPAGVICEIMNDDGTMARVPELAAFCEQYDLAMITVAELIRYRLAHERYVEREAEVEHATVHGRVRLLRYRNTLDGEQHTAWVLGTIDLSKPVLARVQNHCLAATLGSLDCECGRNLEAARRQIAAAGAGVIVYLHPASREAALVCQPSHEAGSPVLRQIGVGAQILTDLGIRELRLLTNHPRRVAGLDGFGLNVAEQVPLTGDAVSGR
jgi:3,4-dihydroxy 2-butanone 4-phosphate synthase/GTP cyclohydrolase II